MYNELQLRSVQRLDAGEGENDSRHLSRIRDCALWSLACRGMTLRYKIKKLRKGNGGEGGEVETKWDKWN